MTAHAPDPNRMPGTRGPATPERARPADPGSWPASLKVTGPGRPLSPRVAELMRRAASLALANDRLVDHSARSIFTFVQDTISYLTVAMREEREALRHGTNADRLELVSVLLDGSPVEIDLAGARLGHDMRAQQTAAIFWTEPVGRAS